MKKIEAKIIADSINQQGDRITTFLLTYPRFIHSELMTHRMFSRNSASSRAIPFEKMVKMVEEDPFIPIAWQKDHKGMQGTEYFQGSCKDEFGHLDRAFAGYEIYQNKDSVKQLTEEWLEARDNSIQQAKALNYLGVTKQLCNRLLEPFMWHTVLCTSTEFENFFELRCPKYTNIYGTTFKSKKDYLNHNGLAGVLSEDGFRSVNTSQAEIHIQALAEAMWDEYQNSIPKLLKSGQWHIPFGNNITMENFRTHKDEELMEFTDWYKVKIATARAARLSYMTFDGEIDYEKDIKLHDSLLESHHMSPFEHCCRAVTEEEYNENFKGKEKGWFRNFKGFKSYRQILEE